MPVTKVQWSRGFRTDDCLLHSKAQFHPFLELDKSALQLYTGCASLVLAWKFCWWWRMSVYFSAMLPLEKLILIPRGQKHCLCISHVPGCCSSQVFLDFQHFQGRLFRDIFLSMKKRHFLHYQLIILKISQNVTCHSHYHIWASTTIIASAEEKKKQSPTLEKMMMMMMITQLGGDATRRTPTDAPTVQVHLPWDDGQSNQVKSSLFKVIMIINNKFTFPIFEFRATTRFPTWPCTRPICWWRAWRTPWTSPTSSTLSRWEKKLMKKNNSKFKWHFKTIPSGLLTQSRSPSWTWWNTEQQLYIYY